MTVSTGTLHERPGVYSSYDAHSALSASAGTKTVGAVAVAAAGTPGQVVELYSYGEALSAFGADAEGSAGMATLTRLLFANGASCVAAVAVDAEGDYAAAFALLESRADVKIVVCDSADASVHAALRESVCRASENRRERVGVVGGDGDTVSELAARAKALNCERMVLLGGDAALSDGTRIPGALAAGALAGLLAAQSDPSLPIQGAALALLGGTAEQYNDNQLDTLIRAGVTPLEELGGTVSPVRGVTTRSMTDGVADATWRELTTILIVDDVIPALRDSLRSRFARSKNTAQSRGAIRSQVVLELENRRALERIEDYGEVRVSAMDGEPTVCLVEFSFTVAHGLSRIYLTAHITV